MAAVAAITLSRRPKGETADAAGYLSPGIMNEARFFLIMASVKTTWLRRFCVRVRGIMRNLGYCLILADPVDVVLQ